MRGMWVWPESVQHRSVQRLVERCVQTGITDLFFLTKGLSGLVSFTGLVAPSVCERDLLQEITEAAHRAGIRVHAWFTSACDAAYKERHPESGRFHLQRGRDRELISLTDEGYLHYMECIIREVCRKYDVDGIHLDYIRYNHLLYGWSADDFLRYRDEGANADELRTLMERMFYDPAKEPELLFDQWRNGNESVRALARRRRKDVVHFAETLALAARAEKSHLILSAALMPEGAYEDKAFSDLHYGQNYADMSRMFDYAVPMAYSQAYQKDSNWVKMVAEGTLKSGMKTIVGLHAYDGATGISLQQDIEALKEMPIEGFSLFREGATAIAIASKGTLTVFNALHVPVTKLIVAGGGEILEAKCHIASDTEKSFQLSFCPEKLQVYAGNQECCVYLIKE